MLMLLLSPLRRLTSIISLTAAINKYTETFFPSFGTALPGSEPPLPPPTLLLQHPPPPLTLQGSLLEAPRAGIAGKREWRPPWLHSEIGN
ncbi:hypothetical protein L1987_38766 [Smallanthus sonchifolius]|uniref:Uncharacterized protein n=1 Tax=Smallanthus sonchifolius TaxID=185202 RepID=A0ACB9HJZ5_9ASTR|nr:hypothetical protein L1987_38766 [Smallanthus sonchifolius]